MVIYICLCQFYVDLFQGGQHIAGFGNYKKYNKNGFLGYRLPTVISSCSQGDRISSVNAELNNYTVKDTNVIDIYHAAHGITVPKFRRKDC